MTEQAPDFENAPSLNDVDVGHEGEATALEMALGYARRGWYIFPVPPNAKLSYKSAENSNGRKWGMTKDFEEINSDFRRFSYAGVGIPTGKVNGIFVVEVDTKKATTT